jgi:hypothetical protein
MYRCIAVILIEDYLQAQQYTTGLVKGSNLHRRAKCVMVEEGNFSYKFILQMQCIIISNVLKH